MITLPGIYLALVVIFASGMLAGIAIRDLKH